MTASRVFVLTTYPRGFVQDARVAASALPQTNSAVATTPSIVPLPIIRYPNPPPARSERPRPTLLERAPFCCFYAKQQRARTADSTSVRLWPPSRRFLSPRLV